MIKRASVPCPQLTGSTATHCKRVPQACERLQLRGREPEHLEGRPPATARDMPRRSPPCKGWSRFEQISACVSGKCRYGSGVATAHPLVGVFAIIKKPALSRRHRSGRPCRASSRLPTSSLAGERRLTSTTRPGRGPSRGLIDTLSSPSPARAFLLPTPKVWYTLSTGEIPAHLNQLMTPHNRLLDAQHLCQSPRFQAMIDKSPAHQLKRRIKLESQARAGLEARTLSAPCKPC